MFFFVHRTEFRHSIFVERQIYLFISSSFISTFSYQTFFGLSFVYKYFAGKLISVHENYSNVYADTVVVYIFLSKLFARWIRWNKLLYNRNFRLSWHKRREIHHFLLSYKLFHRCSPANCKFISMQTMGMREIKPYTKWKTVKDIARMPA